MENITIEAFLSFIILALIILFTSMYIHLIKKFKKKLKCFEEVDTLIGTISLSKFTTELQKKISTAKPNEYYLLSFDVDNMKYVNQNFGFDKGNDLLRSIANNISKYTNNETLFCRYQHDIFILFGRFLQKDQFNLSNPIFSQERCDAIVAEAGLNTTIHFSTGVYFIKDPAGNHDNIIDCVKKARLLAKQKYGNSIAFYSEEIQRQSEREILIYSTMEDAIKNKEFFIVIQPQVELSTKKLIGGEILVRWKKADGTMLFPDEFIPLFEKNHFITFLDKYVFESACILITETNQKLPILSINVSLVTVLEDNFIDDYLEILNRYGLKPDQFDIEITESAIDSDFDKLITISKKLRKLGFKLSIDDFGKGASSLSRIKELDIDVIKLDRGFITNNFNVEKGNVVIANAISLVNNLGITSLAEGLETQEHLKLLLSLNCKLGQGYLFSKPISTDEFLLQIAEDNENLH